MSEPALKVLIVHNGQRRWMLIVEDTSSLRGKLSETVHLQAGDEVATLLGEFEPDEDPATWLARVRTDAKFAEGEYIKLLGGDYCPDLVEQTFGLAGKTVH